MLFNAKLVALLTEEDSMWSAIVKPLQSKVDKISDNSHYLNQIIKDLHESGGLLYTDGKFHLKKRGFEDSTRCSSRTIRHELPRPVYIVASYKTPDLLPRDKLFPMYTNR